MNARLKAWAVGGAVLALVGAGLVWRRSAATQARETRYDGLIEAAAERHGVPPELIKAVIKTESHFDPDVRGKAGEIGLMQVGPLAVADWEQFHHRSVGFFSNMHNPALNIEIGTWYLAAALRQWAGRPEQEILALVQYNAGRKWALKLAQSKQNIILSEVPIASTRSYITNILKYRSVRAVEQALT